MFRSTQLLTPPSGWWTRPWYIALLAILSVIPLLRPEVPPLIDLMGHMGRYRVELADPSSPLLTRYFSFQWALMGNLGVDLLMVPMAKTVVILLLLFGSSKKISFLESDT